MAGEQRRWPPSLRRSADDRFNLRAYTVVQLLQLFAGSGIELHRHRVPSSLGSVSIPNVFCRLTKGSLRSAAASGTKA
jgi:hypothetical protein